MLTVDSLLFVCLRCRYNGCHGFLATALCQNGFLQGGHVLAGCKLSQHQVTSGLDVPDSG